MILQFWYNLNCVQIYTGNQEIADGHQRTSCGARKT